MYWPTTKARGARFALIKMTQATSIKDVDAIENMRNSKGIIQLRGGYHFLSSSVGGEAQADYMLDFMENEVGDSGELPECLDVEIDVSATVVKDFVYRVLERKGHFPLIYTSVGMWERVIGDKSWAANCPLFVAHWYVVNPVIPAPWVDYVVHQYSSQGIGKEWGAASNYIDLDRGKDAWLELYVPPPLPPDEIVPIKTVVVSSWLASMRSKPDNTAPEIGKLTRAQRLPVTEVNGDWAKVEAWIPSKNLKDVA